MTIDPRRIAVAFCAISAFVHLYAPQSVLPLHGEELSVGATQASMIVTAGTLAVALTAPFAGAVSDAIGRKRMIVTAMILLLIPTVMLSAVAIARRTDPVALHAGPAAAADLRRDRGLYRR